MRHGDWKWRHIRWIVGVTSVLFCTEMYIEDEALHGAAVKKPRANGFKQSPLLGNSNLSSVASS
jgi:hypothetical protein